jgi:hypothetical protein
LRWTLVLQFVAFPAAAADAAGNYAIWGVGRASCHQYLKSADGDFHDRYRVFVMGYLTAFNTLSEDTYNATGTQSLEKSLVWLSDYCEMHQMESFNRAIQQLLSTSYESRDRVPPGRERGWGRAAVTQEPSAPAPE